MLSLASVDLLFGVLVEVPVLVVVLVGLGSLLCLRVLCLYVVVLCLNYLLLYLRPV